MVLGKFLALAYSIMLIKVLINLHFQDVRKRVKETSSSFLKVFEGYGCLISNQLYLLFNINAWEVLPMSRQKLGQCTLVQALRCSRIRIPIELTLS